MISKTKIDSIVDWYETIESPDLGLLMEQAKILSCQKYEMAKALGDIGKQYRIAHVQRKLLFSKLVSEHIKAGESGKSAEHKATLNADYAKIYTSEYSLEGSTKKGQLMFQSIENILQRMNQEIAELRQEKNDYK